MASPKQMNFRDSSKEGGGGGGGWGGGSFQLSIVVGNVGVCKDIASQNQNHLDHLAIF